MKKIWLGLFLFAVSSCGKQDAETSSVASKASWTAGCYLQGNRAIGYIHISGGMLSGSVSGSHEFRFCDANARCSSWEHHAISKVIVGSGIKEIGSISATSGSLFCNFQPAKVQLH